MGWFPQKERWTKKQHIWKHHLKMNPSSCSGLPAWGTLTLRRPRRMAAPATAATPSAATPCCADAVALPGTAGTDALAAVVGAVTGTVAPWLGRTKARSMARSVGSFFCPRGKLLVCFAFVFGPNFSGEVFWLVEIGKPLGTILLSWAEQESSKAMAVCRKQNLLGDPSLSDSTKNLPDSLES